MFPGAFCEFNAQLQGMKNSEISIVGFQMSQCISQKENLKR